MDYQVYSAIQMQNFRIEGYPSAMDFATQAQLARTGDTSPEAIHRRLIAAQKITGMNAKQLAADAGIRYTTYKHQEKSGSPSVTLMAYLMRAHLVDFNFVLGGEIARLPADVRDALIEALASGENCRQG